MTFLSLTYDDGLHQHLDHALPDLAAHNLRGSFYVHTAPPDPAAAWYTRRPEWAEAAAAGHEIGNHTRVHPCRGKIAGLAVDLSRYTLPQIESEITQADLELRRLSPSPRSFAYPCGHTTVGPDDHSQSFTQLCDRLFPASRIVGNAFAIPPHIDFSQVPSFLATDELTPLPRLLELLDEAEEQNAWLTFTFHGIGGGHLNTSRSLHQELLSEIARRQSEGKLSCMPFVEAAARLRMQLGRPWLPS